MSQVISREIHLAARPRAMPTPTDFTMVEVELPPLDEQHVLVRNLFMSVDPYMRSRMNAGRSYVPQFEIGQPLEGAAVGEVVASRAKGFNPGDIVTSSYGWREVVIASPKNLTRVEGGFQPLSLYLGLLGMTGMTAWAGLQLAELKAGDVVYISGAAGAVGNVFGQLAKLRGCRVVGSAGSSEKITFLKEDCGFDDAFNYKTGPILPQLNAVAPGGIDVYFDNVGGETLEAALTALRVHGRIVACGGISGYNVKRPLPGPTNLFYIITKRLTMKGLLVFDWIDQQAVFEQEVGGAYHAGLLKNKETVVEGIEHAVGAFLGLFDGTNIGKMVVKLN